MDERNKDDDPLEDTVKQLEAGIKEKLEIASDVTVIPMNSLALYHLQCAWGAFAPENADHTKALDDNAKSHLNDFFEDCAKTISQMRRTDENDKKWFHDHDVMDVDDETVWDGKALPHLLSRVYAASRANDLWKTLHQKLREQICAVIVNPALEKTVWDVDNFAQKLEGVLNILRMSTEDEVRKQQQLVSSTLADTRQQMSELEQKFKSDFSQSINACISREAKAIESTPYSKRFEKMTFFCTEICDDVRKVFDCVGGK